MSQEPGKNRWKDLLFKYYKYMSVRNVVMASVSTYFAANAYKQLKKLRKKEDPVILFRPDYPDLPTRQEHLMALKEQEFDVLVIGGGATGCGVAVDAASRGLKTALVEKYDFSSGTSSRSTKLLHGGIRYLASAIREGDYSHLQLVKDALQERGRLIANAPHLAFAMPILLPIYNWGDFFYYYSLVQSYDSLSVPKPLQKSYILNKGGALDKFPMLDASKLKAALVYFDGSFDDSRYNIALAITAVRHGASVANYCGVVRLMNEEDFLVPEEPEEVEGEGAACEEGDEECEAAAAVEEEEGGGEGEEEAPEEAPEEASFIRRVIRWTSEESEEAKEEEEEEEEEPCEVKPGGWCGAEVMDMETGKTFRIRAKTVINATGPFTDVIRKLDNPESEDIITPSAGVHIILPGYYSPDRMGLVDPQTSDGRVLFMLPWMGYTLAGTTDTKSAITHEPSPTEEEIQFILTEMRNYFGRDLTVRRGDVKAAWSGLRPLATDPDLCDDNDTKSLSRCHFVHVSDRNLITVAGGKWTTYRVMAEECVDRAIEVGCLEGAEPCQTVDMKMEGAHLWRPISFMTLVQDYGLEAKVAQHLSAAYGDRAEDVAKLATVTGKPYPTMGIRLVHDFPYIEAEVRYAVREYARSAADVLALRTRLSALDWAAADEAVPRVVEVMGEELCWDDERKRMETEKAHEMIAREMGKSTRVENLQARILLTKEEVEEYGVKFRSIDADDKGFITRVDMSRIMEKLEVEVDDDVLQMFIDQADLNHNGKVELEEFLAVMSDLKHGEVQLNAVNAILKSDLHLIPPDKSGGGL